MDLDAQLLDRYARTRDGDAFTQLVRRHAGMVFTIAHRVTHHHHNAEEIAQSCFLELAAQAASIQGRDDHSLAAWLHTVATNRALDHNRAAERRRRRERAAARPEAVADQGGNAVAPLVHEALAALPEKLRLPVVLYHLQERTHAQIAAALGVSKATAWRRVEAGVAALREKFTAAGEVALRA